LRSVVGIFEAKAGDIASVGNVGQASDEVLAKVRDGLQGLGFKVETAKTAAGKVKVPVLYGRNGKDA
jgi:hypothetical protein